MNYSSDIRIPFKGIYNNINIYGDVKCNILIKILKIFIQTF